jgi:hypothetical protein
MAKRRSTAKQGKKRGNKPIVEKDVPVDEARREVLKRLGLFGAYTAPAILGMAWSDKAVAIIVGSGE